MTSSNWQPVVIGVDSSPAAAEAVRVGWTIARTVNVPCHLVHATPEAWTVPTAPHAGTEQPELLNEAVRDAAKSAVRDTLADAVPDEALQFLEVRTGRSATVIRDCVREWQAGLAVLGGKHHSMLGRWVSGSTAHTLVRSLDVDDGARQGDIRTAAFRLTVRAAPAPESVTARIVLRLTPEMVSRDPYLAPDLVLIIVMYRLTQALRPVAVEWLDPQVVIPAQAFLDAFDGVDSAESAQAARSRRTATPAADKPPTPELTEDQRMARSAGLNTGCVRIGVEKLSGIVTLAIVEHVLPGQRRAAGVDDVLAQLVECRQCVVDVCLGAIRAAARPAARRRDPARRRLRCAPRRARGVGKTGGEEIGMGPALRNVAGLAQGSAGGGPCALRRLQRV